MKKISLLLGLAEAIKIHEISASILSRYMEFLRPKRSRRILERRPPSGATNRFKEAESIQRGGI